jgi:hypothetical protein
LLVGDLAKKRIRVQGGRGKVAVDLGLFEKLCDAPSYSRHQVDEFRQAARLAQLPDSFPIGMIAVL